MKYVLIIRLELTAIKAVERDTPRLWNTGLVSSGASLTSWGKAVSLALVGHPSSDAVMIKMLG